MPIMPDRHDDGPVGARAGQSAPGSMSWLAAAIKIAFGAAPQD